MEPKSINSLDLVLMIVAGIFFILWVVYLVKLFAAERKVRRRNSFIWKQWQEQSVLRARLRSENAARREAEEDLEAARAANDALTGKPVESGTVSAPEESLRDRIDDAMGTTHRFLRASFDRDEMAELMHVEKRELDETFSDISIQDYISRWRMNYAVSLMKENPDKELGVVASESGFANQKALDRACRSFMGMGIEELSDVIES